MRTGFKVWEKGLLFWANFVSLHFAYDLIPILPVKIIAGINESVFQHLKMGFFVYLFTSGVEFLIFGRRAPERDSWIYSRRAAAVFAPWIIFLLWYLAPALYGRWPNTTLEVVWANCITIIAGWFAATIERGLAQIKYSKPLKAVILFLVLASACLYIIFTFNLPWADVFAEPKWK